VCVRPCDALCSIGSLTTLTSQLQGADSNFSGVTLADAAARLASPGAAHFHCELIAVSLGRDEQAAMQEMCGNGAVRHCRIIDVDASANAIARAFHTVTAAVAARRIVQTVMTTTTTTTTTTMAAVAAAGVRGAFRARQPNPLHMN
jgi:hypothetical protein